MIRHVSKASLALALIVFLSCESVDSYVREYPVLFEATVTSISAEGITVSTSINTEALDNVIEYGFRWEGFIPENSPVSVFYTPFPGKPSSMFSADIRSRLAVKTNYTIRSYVRTNRLTVFGPTSTFVSQGSIGPVIESISPKEAFPGESITIKGKGFGFNRNGTTVLLRTTGSGGIACEIQSYSETQIVIQIPNVTPSAGRLVVLAPEHHEVISGETIQTKARESKLFEITNTDPCKPLTISGEYLLSNGVPGLRVNGISIADKIIADQYVTIPARAQNERMTVLLVYDNGRTLSKTFDNPGPRPVVTSMPGTVVSSDVIKIQGLNFPTCPLFGVQATNGADVVLQAVTPTELTLKVNDAGCGSFNLEFYLNVWKMYTSGPIQSLDNCLMGG
jgi:hypothetical protein